MIRIIDKRECCGCEACVQVCPKHCIDFSSDFQGFCYPQVDEAHCINCGLCEKVCPIINVTDGVYEESLPVYASYNSRDDERKSSSSGGLFSLLANKTLDENGVVFGAMFDDKWNEFRRLFEEKCSKMGENTEYILALFNLYRKLYIQRKK